MRGLIADLRYGLSELLSAPKSGSRSAVWLLAGVLVGLSLAWWVDAPLSAPLEGPAAAPAEATRVPASRLLDPEAETRLRCLAGHPACPTATPPTPCAVPTPRRLES